MNSATPNMLNIYQLQCYNFTFLIPDFKFQKGYYYIDVFIQC